MKVRRAEKADHDQITHWFAHREWPYPPVDDFFPETGLVSETETGVLLNCMFVYTTPTSIAQLSWFGDNPNIEDQKLIDEGYRNIIKTFQELQMQITPPIRLVEVITKDKRLLNILAESKFYIRNGFSRATFIPPREGNVSKETRGV